MLERTRLRARGRPALPRCADGESGDKMIDRVLIPVVECAVARSLEAVQRGHWRQAPFGSRPQTIVVTTGERARLAASGGGGHLLCVRRLDRGERLVAELLRRSGAADDTTADDRLVSACLRADRAEARLH